MAARRTKHPRKELKAAKPPASKPAKPARISQKSEALVTRAAMQSLDQSTWDRILATKPEDSPAGKLLALMHQPGQAFKEMSLERKCAEAGVDFADLVTLVSEHALGSAIIDSAAGVAEVVQGLHEDAKSRTFICDLCLGDGTVDVESRRAGEGTRTIECPQCGGEGRRRKAADARARETFLKLHGGLKEEPGVAVNVNTQMNFGSQHVGSVRRGQQLLAEGRARQAGGKPPAASTAVIDVTPAEESS